MKKASKSIQIAATLDRFEGEIGVVYLGENEDHKVDIPRSYLPAGVQAGAHLKITIAVDEAATEEIRNQIRNLQQELLNRNK